MENRTWKTFQIHGTRILLGGDDHLTGRVAEYFSLLYRGGMSEGRRLLKFEVYPAKQPPCLPADAVKAIQGPYASCYGWGDRVLFMAQSGNSMVCLDPPAGKASGVFDREFSEDPQKFFSILGMTVLETLKYRGLYFLHGACVYGNGKAYLFSGHSGAGKTTAAFSLVRQGFRFVADDSLFLSDRDGDIIVSPYYTNFHVDEKIVERYPETTGARKLRDRARGFTRVRVNMSELYADSFVPFLRPDLVIFPQIVAEGASSFSAVSQIMVYERLLKQTALAADPGIARDQLRAIERLARQVKGFDLLTGPDMYKDPTILPDILGRMT